ncbi:ABC transporter permease [Lentilitoribacter sp. EG35]|uniref:ABC transporter permease n=1 Tax=Lentilitoribacter sp. EG35 TaxID=3234192 RepID=UPI003460BD96
MKMKDWLKVVLLLLPGVGLIVFFMGTVAYIAFAQSFGLYNLSGVSEFSTSFWEAMVSKKAYMRSVRFSLYVATISALLSVAIAYPIALWLRKPFRGSIAVGALLKAPLLVHGLVAAFLFINIIAYHGLLNQTMIGLGIWNEPRRLQNDRNAIGVIILQTWKNMPFALLLLTGAVQSISDDVLNAGRDLGAGAFDRFRKIIAPLTVSAMQAALVIIFIGALSDFSFQTIAGPTNRQSMAQYMTYFSDLGRWNEAGVVGVTLMIVSFVGAITLTLAARFIFGGRRS